MNLRSAGLVLLTAMSAACDRESSPALAAPASASTPALVSNNDLLTLSVGTPIAYDATKAGAVFSDPTGRGLTYSISLSGTAANGLISAGAL